MVQSVLFLLPVLLGLATAQQVHILSQSPLVTEYGREESIVCVAFINQGVAMVFWNSTAENADLSNVKENLTNDNGIPDSVDIVTLTITVDSDYCGLYACSERMLSDIVFETIYVDVAPAVSGHPTHASIGASQLSTRTVSFTCLVDGGPGKPVQIEWMGPNSTLTDTLPPPVNTLEGNSRVRSALTLSNITYDYVGDYWCRTRYTDEDCNATSPSNRSALFIVKAPDILIEPDPPRQNISAGSLLSYTCSFNASERASRLSFQPNLSNFSVFWIGPSGPLENGADYEIVLSSDEDIVNSTLILTNASSAEGGLYSCVAENIDGSVNGTALLFVDPIIEPTNYTAAVNETLVILCDVQDFPIPSFRWQKEMNGSFYTLDPVVNTNGRIVETTRKNLTFDPVIFGDDGMYRCVVNTTEFGSVFSTSALVTVSPEGGVTVSPVDQIFNSDDNITLTCDTLGGPDNQFDWTVVRNDEAIQGPRSPTFDLVPVQGGVYTCAVSNAAGRGSATTTAFVNLRFIVHPNDTLTEVQLRAILTCEAESFPNPTYEWFRSSGSIRDDLIGINSSSLVVDPVLFGDEGAYYCQATSRSNFTLSSRTATLTVSPLRSVTVWPGVQVANFSSEVTFNCSSLGGPNNTYQWYRDSQLLVGETGVNITLNVTAANGGVYTCTVSNAAGNDSDSAILYVRPYIVVAPETEITTTAGSAVNFTCVAAGFPLPEIEWVKLNGSERNLVRRGELLNFSPVQFGDEGMYECVASSSVPDETNSTRVAAALTVSPEGSVGVAPIDRVYYFNDNVTLVCSFLGGLNNAISWTKDGRELAGMEEEELTLRDIDSQDGGAYICTVSNSAGNESAGTTLYVAPYFIEDPVDIFSSNGTNVNFSCTAESFPSPSYEWIRADGRVIRADAIGQNSSLLDYSPVLFGDEGVYFCEATILNVSISSELATLTLSPDGVSVTLLPSDERFFGQSVNLTCEHFGGPNNSYSWLKDGEVLRFENTSSLSLGNVTAVDGGTYTCIVTNPAGSARSNVPLYVQPYVTVPPRELVVVENGSLANFSCEVEGFPAPNITWVKYESYVNRSRFVVTGNGGVLAFEPALFGDEGYYACVASSSRFDGRELADAVSEPPSELAVSPTPSVEIADHNGTFFLGDNTTLSCSSLGGPNNTYSWLLNGEVVGVGPSLELTGIDAGNGGEYTCNVSNSAGADSDTTNLYVYPYIVTMPELDILTMDGEYVSIECIADGFPAPNVTWESLGLELGNLSSGTETSGSGMEDDRRTELAEFDNRPLEFSLVTFGNEGYYRCVVNARTPEGIALETVTSQPTLVTVSPEGSIRVTPQFQVLSRFDSINFTCSSLGGPSNAYQWQKDETNISNETSQVLTVSNVSAVDGGKYSCVVSNAAGNETADGTLYIEPYITVDPVPDTLSPAGENVSFECEAESFPPPRYLWEKVSDNDTVVRESRGLSFSPVVFGDEGTYRCVAYIIANGSNVTAASETGLLTVSPEGGVSSSPSVHNSSRNQTVQFLCLSLGGLGNTFSWLRLFDRASLSNDSLLEVTVGGEFSGGGYLCEVSNRAGNGSFEATLNVAPLITEHPGDLNVTITRSFSLSCGANGYPIPSIVWMRNGTEVDTSNDTFSSGSGFFSTRIEENYGLRSISSRLTVSMAMTNDSGNYSCLIVSPVEEYQVLMTRPSLVLVQDAPDPPHSLISEAVTNTSMILVWSEPHDNNAPILGYQITYYHPQFLGGGEVVLSSPVEMRFIGGLHPGVIYNFTVAASNEIGASELSNLTGLATLDEEPSSAPSDLSSVVLSSTSMFLSWNEIPEIDRNGIITTYEVQYVPLVNCSSIESSRRSGSGDLRQLLLDGLEEDIPYSLSVRAYTSAGPGPFGEVVTNTTLEDVPSAAPPNINVGALSPTQLFVQWDQINCQEQNGEVVSYELVYQTFNTFVDNLPFLSFNLSTTSLSAVLDDLEEYNAYEVAVRGLTSVGPGPYSSFFNATTLQDVPAAPPTNVRVGTINSTVLLVVWEEVPLVHQNGNITQYEILYEPLVTFGGLIGPTSTLVGFGLSAELTGLEENVEYNVSVRAYTIGPGPYSEPVTNATSQDVPGSPPADITVAGISSNQLNVSWGLVPEIERNGPIDFYEVLYSPFGTFDGKLNVSYSVQTSSTSVVLDSLEEFLEYNVSVRAYSSIGPGIYSEPVSNRTLPAAPSGPVRNVRGSANSATTITVVWNEVEPIDQNGIQSLYEINFQPETTFDNYTVPNGTVNTTTRGQFLVTDLEEHVMYSITVRSFTIAGPGPFSDAVTVETLQAAPSGPPTSVFAEALDSTSILVTWDEVVEIDQNGVVTLYDVRVEPFTTFDSRIPSFQSVNVSGGDLSVVFVRLEEFVEYNVTLRAWTAIGSGPFSERISTTTDSALPASPPLNVSVYNVSSTELTVTWEPPDPRDRNGVITEYCIELNQTEFTEIPETTSVTMATMTGINERLVSGLEENVEYSVSVRAINSVGPSPYSGLVNGITSEDKPSAPPRNLTVRTTGPNNLSVSWFHPPAIDINGDLVRYAVQYGLANSTSSLEQFELSGSSLGLTLTGLNNFTSYTISVAAQTIVGEGPLAIMDGITAENVPGEPPTGVTVSSNSFETIVVTWIPPRPEFLYGVLRGYTVRYLNNDFPQEGYVYIRGEIPSGGRAYTISGLVQFTNYSVEVAAVTVGDGVFSGPMSVRTDQDLPDGFPEDIQVFPQPSDPKTLLITWGEVRMALRNGIIVRYDVRYEPLETYGGQLRNDTMSVSSRMAVLSGLEEDTPYNISVQAFTIVGPGPFSTQISARTSEGVPTAVPSDLAVNDALKFSRNMTIQWNDVPLIHQNGEIISYTLRYGPVDAPAITVNVSAESESFEATDLTPGRLYTIEVAASTRRGQGDFSQAVFERTREERPGVISNLIKIERFTSITVEWDVPVEPNGDLIIFEVRYNKSLTAVPVEKNVSLIDSFFRLGDLSTGQIVTFQVRAYTQIGPGPFTPIHTITREKPPQIQNVTVTADENSPGSVAIVQWAPLTDLDLENVIQYRISYQSKDGTRDIFVSSNTSSWRVEGLSLDSTYLFQVFAIARIDNDTIEGDPSLVSPIAIHSIPPTQPPDPLPGIQLGTSVPATFILTALACVIIFLVLVFVWRCHQSRKPQVPVLRFDSNEGHYETVEMMRRQLPQIPPPPDRSIRQSTLRTVNESYKTVDRQSHNDVEDFYDNEEPAVTDTGLDRYSAVPKTPPSSIRRTIMSDTPLKGTVIANTETYDTVVEAEEPQELYDSDPFETEQLSVRRDSNPNIYSEVRAQERAKGSSKMPSSKGEVDTSLVVQNPMAKSEDQPKPYEELPSQKPSSNQSAPADKESEEEDVEEYVEVLSPLPLLGQSPMATKKTAGERADSTERGQEVDGDKTQEVSSTTGSKPAPYFLFSDEYDTIIQSELEKKREADRAQQKQEVGGDRKPEVSDDKQEVNQLQFDEEYDTVVQKEPTEAEEQQLYMDMSGEFQATQDALLRST